MSTWGCTLRDVAAGWKTQAATFERLSLSVPADRLRALPLVGRSGAGKSTLLYLLAALKWPTHGEIAWCLPDGKKLKWGADGLPSREADRLRRCFFGFAFQNSTLLPHLRIEENLTYPLLLAGRSEEEASKKAREAFEAVLLGDEVRELDDFLRRFPDRLSGGQHQRAALAQALIHDPVVLFADEPAGSLDLATRRQVMDVLRRWVDKGAGRRLLLWVTHHTDDPELMEAEQVLQVEDGRAELCDRAVFESRVREISGAEP